MKIHKRNLISENSRNFAKSPDKVVLVNFLVLLGKPATASDPNREFGADGANIMKIGCMRTYFGPLQISVEIRGNSSVNPKLTVCLLIPTFHFKKC